ncbi:MAG: flagellar biosynthesis protein FlhB [Syntrophomonas sp.]
MGDLAKWFIFDLQLLAEGDTGEKTEKATPRRREEARKKGQVFKSADLSSAVILVAGSMAMIFSFPYIVSQIKGFTQLYLLHRGTQSLTQAYTYYMFLEAMQLMGRVCLPVLGTTFITALLVSYLQVGFIFSTESLTPDLNRLNPVEGFKRVFSRRALAELLKSLAKVFITGYVVYTIIKDNYAVFPRFIDMELGASMVVLGDIVFEIALKVGIVYVIIGIVDYIFQWFEYEKSLKMSKYDIKQEWKQNEGDPQLRSRQKQIQREMAMRRMMSEVPRADVVITNPTHFAVALRYDAPRMAAPVVVAKGQDYMALRIREIASQNRVALVENPPLARTLYSSTDIGDVVPADLYQAVAEVLAFVYRQKKVAL